MPNRIVGDCVGEEIDSKRFYLPGVKVTSNCPGCDDPYERDMASNYLSYPVIGRATSVHFECEKCDKGWTVPVVLKVTLEIGRVKDLDR